jgi:acyl carrier protein
MRIEEFSMLDQATRKSADRLKRLAEQFLVSKSGARSISVEDGLIDAGLTSIDMVNLMLAVEAEFDVSIPQSAITPENFRSVSTIEALILKLDPSLSR